ncbi:hypothetical protein Bca4012_087432 [Brassica carinata]|uniref:J domain-containing protein n=1 Tax=Brassica oleracea var. oleracea TaxID=109376 RepID=A0A0D3A4E5_BRAOL
MECNKDEAKRAMDIAEKKLSEKDYVGAKKFVTKAQNLYPHLDGLNQVSMMIHVYITAANKIINGGKESDLYGVIGVDPLADDEALKKQYKKLALLLHPDKNKCKGAEDAFKLVSNAWSLLSDKAKRAAYDQRIRKSNTGMQKPPSPSQHNRPPGSSNVYQSAGYGVDPNGKPTSNQPASGTQRPPPYAPKPNYSNVNQSAGYGVHPNANNQPASGPPTYAPKPASSSGNPNASRNGVPPNGNTRSNHPASGPQKPPSPHKPTSSNVNQNAKATSNKAAPGPAPTYAPGPVSAPAPTYASGPTPAPTCAPGHVPAPRPVNSSKQMFWTMCNGCKTRSECRKDLYLNKTMRCQNCGQSYTATERNPWDHYVRQLNKALSMIRLRQWSSSAHQNQAANKNTNGGAYSSSVGATKKNHPWESHVSQINHTLSLVVLRQAHWNAQNQAANTNNGGSTSGTSSSSSSYVGAIPEEKFALQQVFSTFSSILQLQQQWSAAEKNNGTTPSVSATGGKGPHASFVRPSVNLSSSPQQQQQCGAQNTSSGTYYPSSSSAGGSPPSVSATTKTPPGSFVSPGVNHSSSPQQQQWGGGTYYPSSSGSVHHKCSVSVSSSSGNAASQAQERCKRGLEVDSQETIAAIESFFKKPRKDVV